MKMKSLLTFQFGTWIIGFEQFVFRLLRGISKAQWEKMKVKEASKKRKNLGQTGITKFKSRSFSDWQASGGKNLFPVDPKSVKNKKELPYMWVHVHIPLRYFAVFWYIVPTMNFTTLGISFDDVGSVLEAWLMTRTWRNPRGWVLSSVRRRNLNRNQIQRRRRKNSGRFKYLKFIFNDVWCNIWTTQFKKAPEKILWI